MTTDKLSKRKKRSRDRGEFKVVFKGHLLAGFEKQQVIENIVQLTKLAPEKIEKKFFSGKVVIIRRAHDESHAQKLQHLFSQAGLEVVILKDVTKKITHQHRSAKKQFKPRKIIKKLKRSKRLLVAILLWGIFLSLMWSFWTQYHIEVPDEVLAIEEALAAKPLLYLAHINVERSVARKNLFLADNSSQAMSQSHWSQQIKQAGLNVEQSVSQVVSAGYIEKGQWVSQTIILGNFSVAETTKSLQENYQAKAVLDKNVPDKDFTHLKIATFDAQSCQSAAFLELSITPERILISSAGHLDELQQLLAKTSTAKTVLDLSSWKTYRQDKLVSLAVFKPAINLASIRHSTMSKVMQTALLMTKGASKKNTAVESVFAGLAMQLLPPAGLLDVTIHSKQGDELKKLSLAMETKLNEMQAMSAGLTNLQNLLNKIHLQSSLPEDKHGWVSMQLKLDNALKTSMQLSMNELVAKFLSTTFDLNSNDLSSTNTASKNKTTEEIELTPVKFQATYQASQLKAFDDSLDMFFTPAWIDGPFAIAVDELLLESSGDAEQIIFHLRGKAQNIDNLGQQQAKIKILAVTDQQGNNVLLKNHCSDSNSKIAETDAKNETYFSHFGTAKTAFVGNKQVHYNELEVRHKVKLKPDVSFSQVKSIRGEIELNLATQTQRIEFQKTRQNKNVMAQDSQILFKPSASDTLSYTVLGNEKRVLSVRALNKNKQVLHRTSRSSMSNLLMSGYSVSQTYQGEIAFIEVIYATEFSPLKYPFEIKKFPPYPSDNQWQYEQERPTLTTLKSWQQKVSKEKALAIDDKQAQWHDGPFNLALHNVKTSQHWGTTGVLLIKTPIIDELRHNLSALEIVLQTPQSKQSYFYPLKAKGYYMNGQFIVDKDKPYMDGQLAFNLDYKNVEVPLKTIHGEVIVHLPLSMHSISFTDMNIGAQWEDEGVRTKIVRIANEVIEFEVSSNQDRLLQIYLLDANNQRISTADIYRGQMQINAGQRYKKSGNIVVSYHGVPVKAVLVVSEGQQIQRYPFELKLN